MTTVFTCRIFLFLSLKESQRHKRKKGFFLQHVVASFVEFEFSYVKQQCAWEMLAPRGQQASKILALLKLTFQQRKKVEILFIDGLRWLLWARLGVLFSLPQCWCFFGSFIKINSRKKRKKFAWGNFCEIVVRLACWKHGQYSCKVWRTNIHQVLRKLFCWTWKWAFLHQMNFEELVSIGIFWFWIYFSEKNVWNFLLIGSFKKTEKQRKNCYNLG